MSVSSGVAKHGSRYLRVTSFICCLFFPFVHTLSAQQNFPLERDALTPYDKLLNDKDVDYHSSVKPFLNNELVRVNDSSIHYRHFKPKQLNDSVSGIKAWELSITPSNVNLTGGYDFLNHSQTADAYGAIGLRLCYKTKFAFVFNYLGGYSRFPGYVDSIVRSTHVVPGTGSAYRSGNGYSYQDYYGYLSFSPNRIFNFQLGKDKHFFGDGYRSMFLSDNAANYPFFKIQAHVWKIKWVNLFTQMTDATAPSALQKDFKSKYASMQYLSWNVTKRINISFFEAIVWQGTDSSRYRGFDVNYLNPVLYYRPTEFSLGSPDNAFVGIATKIKLPLSLQFYGQLMLDEFSFKEMIARTGWWGNKYSAQAGIKAFDVAGIRNLSMLAEFNYVRPYTYSHGSVQQNYGHYNQSLADPFGANFEEFDGMLNYRVKRYIFEIKGVAALTGIDTAGINFGQNIFLPYSTHPSDFGNHVGQGRKMIVGTAELRIGYLIIPSLNLKAELGFGYHVESAAGLPKTQSALITFGIKSSLYNSYRD
ncbi:MAG TPA: hypothetical protein VGO45_00675 [Bacteroidia bacterium]|jgi:hypothetical protein|nr:hypothetical protein [Bacteroidia bacterium]